MSQVVADVIFFDRLRQVGRWTGQYMVDRSNVMAHVARLHFWKVNLTQVMFESYLAAGFDPKGFDFHMNALADYLTVHDMDEVETGDVPHTAKKKYPGLKAALDLVAEKVMQPHVFKVFTFSAVDERPKAFLKEWAKIIDMLDFTFEAFNEVIKGNKSPDILRANRIAYNYVNEAKFFSPAHNAVLAIIDELNPENQCE